MAGTSRWFAPGWRLLSCKKRSPTALPRGFAKVDFSTLTFEREDLGTLPRRFLNERIFLAQCFPILRDLPAVFRHLLRDDAPRRAQRAGAAVPCFIDGQLEYIF